MFQKNEKCALMGLGFLHLNENPHYADFLITAWVSATLLVANILLDRFSKKAVMLWLRKQAPNEKLRAIDASEFFSNAYLTVISIILGVICWIITIYYNDQCTPWSSSHCLEGWPNQQVLPIQRCVWGHKCHIDEHYMRAQHLLVRQKILFQIQVQ
jgi:hypothetical protein